ncbi:MULTISPECIES: DUF742 domain-containing protein [unclassified Streptomyces]|uniref:DUF742 domain-containing protein n=1 Tax=unclassified Streptomyces TaxID=2593676 RepID=UPI00093EC9CD|nr:DUF742 domain-containing protein [Streptomyces sp. TSRI0107]OKJ82398.1 hypothetical protein AMK31_20275 [Streptomyces sp. TSRI0107]
MTPPQRQRRHPQQEPDPAPPKEGEGKNPERLYLIGEGGIPAEMDLVTLIVARGTPPTSLPPEQAALLRLCEAPLSGAELSAYLALPFSVVSVLLTDLLAAGLVQARAPIVRQELPDRSLLEAVMHGLQKL